MPSDEFESLVVTHPFHPLSGQRLRILAERQTRSLGQIFVCEGGPLGVVRLRAELTDRGLPAGRLPVDVDRLAELMAVMSALEKA